MGTLVADPKGFLEVSENIWETSLTGEENAQEYETKPSHPQSRVRRGVSLVSLAVRVGHRFIDPLTPLRMTRSDVSYPKKYRLPAQRRRKTTFLAFLARSHVRGLCDCIARLGRARSDRTRGMYTVYTQADREQNSKYGPVMHELRLLGGNDDKTRIN